MVLPVVSWLRFAAFGVQSLKTSSQICRAKGFDDDDDDGGDDDNDDDDGGNPKP